MRDAASKLAIESFAPEPTTARRGAFFRERGLSHAVHDGLPPSKHVDVTFYLDGPLSLKAKLPQGVEKATSHVADPPPGELRPFWSTTLKILREIGRNRGRATPRAPRGYFSLLASKVQLPLLEGQPTELWMGGGSRANQFTTGSPVMGAAPEEGVHSLKGRVSPHFRVRAFRRSPWEMLRYTVFQKVASRFRIMGGSTRPSAEGFARMSV